MIITVYNLEGKYTNSRSGNLKLILFFNLLILLIHGKKYKKNDCQLYLNVYMDQKLSLALALG